MRVASVVVDAMEGGGRIGKGIVEITGDVSDSGTVPLRFSLL